NSRVDDVASVGENAGITFAMSSRMMHPYRLGSTDFTADGPRAFGSCPACRIRAALSGRVNLGRVVLMTAAGGLRHRAGSARLGAVLRCSPGERERVGLGDHAASDMGDSSE